MDPKKFKHTVTIKIASLSLPIEGRLEVQPKLKKGKKIIKLFGSPVPHSSSITILNQETQISLLSFFDAASKKYIEIDKYQPQHAPKNNQEDYSISIKLANLATKTKYNGGELSINFMNLINDRKFNFKTTEKLQGFPSSAVARITYSIVISKEVELNHSNF
jgi:hypothetical protein